MGCGLGGEVSEDFCFDGCLVFACVVDEEFVVLDLSVVFEDWFSAFGVYVDGPLHVFDCCGCFELGACAGDGDSLDAVGGSGACVG